MAKNQKTAVNEPMRCSFCGRSELEVSNLIVQDEASICDRCVKACQEIIARDRMEGSAEDHEGLLSPQEIRQSWINMSLARTKPRKSFPWRYTTITNASFTQTPWVMT